MSSQASAAADLVRTVERTLCDDGLLRDVRHLLIGCSGGGDSVALVRLLRELRPDLPVTLVHCDHAARSNSADDAEFVRQLAEEMAVPCRVVSTPLADNATGSREAGWRDLRRNAFRKALIDLDADAVALGHTADDQAETVILNVARGCGVRGLAGMAARIDHDGLVVVRPLLAVRRSTLRQYALERRQTWRRDSSNEDLHFSRNRIRASVLPELETIAPGAVGNIVRLAEIVAEHHEFIEAEASAAWPRVELPAGPAGGVALSRPALAKLPRPVAVAVLQRALRGVRGDLFGVSKEHIDTVLGGRGGVTETAIDLPGVRARAEGAALCLLPLENRRVVELDRGQAS